MQKNIVLVLPVFAPSSFCLPDGEVGLFVGLNATPGFSSAENYLPTSKIIVEPIFTLQKWTFYTFLT